MPKKTEEIDDAFSVKLDMCITDGIIKTGNSIYSLLIRTIFASRANLSSQSVFI